MSILGVNLFERILTVLDASMPTPPIYGWYHLLCLAIVIALSFLAAKYGKKLTEKQLVSTLGAVSALLIGLEIYKQINFSYDVETDVWRYQWYAFPFQFCSTPMYVMAAIVFIRKEKIRRWLYAYLATYALFAGLVVMVYPGDVFISTIGINIQTMVHHGAMVVIGVLLFASRRVRAEPKTLLSALPVFLILSGLALLGNVLFEYFGDPSQSFNMFFISPYEVPTLVVFDQLFQYLPYPFYLITYIFGFSLAAFLVLLVAALFKRKNKISRRKS